MIGSTLHHYRILEKIGSGGMGEVYRGQDTKLGREVAIKVLPDIFARDPERLARFEREAQLLATLHHQNIAAIFGVEDAVSLRYLILEYVSGTTLAERLKAGPLPIDEALTIARQTAQAIEAAHEKGIIHRDLKPANVKVTPEGKVKVLDFGLAKALLPETTPQAISDSPTLTTPATRQDVILGTAPYMSPEQARGKVVDKRADIWAFGCLLFELLTGKQAFNGETMTDVLAAVVRGEPHWNSLPSNTPAKVRETLHRCLQKDPLQRLRDIGDARIVIEEAFEGAAAPQPATSAFPATRAPGVRTWQAIPWALALVMSTVAAVSVWRALHTSVGPSKRSVRLMVTVPAGEPIAAGRGQPALALAPDGKRLAYVARHGGTTQLYIRPLDEFGARPLAGSEGASAPFFSPDSQWVAFFAHGKLKKVAVTGGEVLTLCDAPDPEGGTWASDDTIYFNPDWRRGLARVSAGGGRAEEVTKPDLTRRETGHWWPEALPGGHAILFNVRRGASGETAAVAALSLKTGQWKTIIEGSGGARYVPSGHIIYVHPGGLLAAPFNLDQLAVTGAAVPVLSGVLTDAINGFAQYGFSSDGSLAYIPGAAAEAERALVWVDRKGQERTITKTKHPYEDLSLSPDGRQIALTIEGPAFNVWVYDVGHETLTRLTFDDDCRDPLWSPDGKRVVYTSFRNGRYSLYWKLADGSGEEELLASGERILWAQSWSPDGKLLAYGELEPAKGYDVWLLPVEGERKPRPLLHTPFTETLAAISSDGHWLAYSSNESGREEVYVQPVSGQGGKWQISTEGGTRPAWARNGRELFYRDGDHLLAVSVQAGPSFSAGTPRVLFERPYLHTGRDYAPASDGQQFLFIKETEQEVAPTQINVVLNWFEDLERRSPAAATP
jgi:serine/threonine-protein kinase